MAEAKIVVRMAPSPTGNLHIGGVRTALFNYLFAKHNGGKYLLRIEDTDTARNKPEYEEDILNGFKWLGLEHDEWYRQSSRVESHKKYLKKLIDEGVAYVSKEEPKEEGQRDEVIRFRNPNKKVQFDDMIRGLVEFDTTDLGDFVIAKSLEEPIYHFAVVVDDFESGITHVIRGEEHVSNTPRQILIQEAIGAPRPVYAHIPLIVNEAREKLSKRKHGEMVWLTTYRNKGYLPQAIINYMALLGWNPGTEQEIFTLEELVKEFDFSKVHKSGAAFDIKKLDWINKEHIKRLPPEEQRKLLLKSIESEPYMVGEPMLDVEKIAWRKSTKEDAKKHLEEAKKIIEADGNVMEYAERVGKGDVLWPLRYALSGAEASPDPLTLLEILGKEKSLKRIEHAIMVLNEAS
jgi:glutamyl/glutaminyl-tRNA synthetase